jgi:hypothetical protein
VRAGENGLAALCVTLAASMGCVPSLNVRKNEEWIQGLMAGGFLCAARLEAVPLPKFNREKRRVIVQSKTKKTQVSFANLGHPTLSSAVKALIFTSFIDGAEGRPTPAFFRSL